jgi:glycosyltransferase involved in cell wall biosynthesis
MRERATTCACSPRSKLGTNDETPGVRVLHAIHDFLPRHRAGSEIYAFHLCRAQAARHEVAVLCAEYDPSRSHGEITQRQHEGLRVFELVNNWAFQRFEESYRSPFVAKQVEAVLDDFQPELLHVHNLLNLSLEVPALARRRGIPVVATLHDHTLSCPSGGQRVHIAEAHTCVELDFERCARCFAQSPFAGQMAVGRHSAQVPPFALRWARALRGRFPNAAAALSGRIARTSGPRPIEIQQRLACALRAAESVDLFVAPSQALADEHRRLGFPAAKLRVSDYGFPPLAAAGARVARDPQAPLAIGFVGTLVWHKGVHVLLKAAALLPRDRFEIHVFGSLDTFPDYVASLRRLAEGLPVRFRGGFESRDAARVYAELDVLVVSSLWPENSPLVIHEAFQAGVPVVGACVGGIPALLEEGRAGLLYDAHSPADLARALTSLLDSRERLVGLATRIPAVKPIEQDAAEWEAIYTELRMMRPGATASFAQRAEGERRPSGGASA